MERKKPAQTPEQYTRSIISLSRRYSSVSTFPGNNYIDLGEWMLQDRGIFCSAKAKLEQDASIFASKSKRLHDLVVVYNSGERKWDVQQYSQEQHQDFSAETLAPTGGLGQMIFIRGFISPSWVSTIGSKYSVDPEFFRRHMDFLSGNVHRHAFSYPSLPSSSNNMFRLCVSTVLHRDDIGGQDIQSQRLGQRSELDMYKRQQLRSTGICCGDSVVREYSTVCPSFSVIEQWISLYIAKTDRGWTAIAWMDQGRPLEQSPPGPWTSHLVSNAMPLPILQYHPKMSCRTTSNRLSTDGNGSADVLQSTSILPLQYDSLLSLVDLAQRAQNDPLSMCIPLFAHSAFSEVQFLNLMESRIQEETNTITEGVSVNAVATFQYFSNILGRHAQQLKDSTRALNKLTERNIQSLNGTRMDASGMRRSVSPHLRPVSPNFGVPTHHRQASGGETAKNSPFGGADGAFAAKNLLEDFEHLHGRCIDLSKQCTRGITLAMNKATVEESRKAVEQSERLKKLTVLAALFIPLSFSASLFSMNVDLLKQNSVSFWWFIVICVPITLSACIFYAWDTEVVRRWRVVFRRHCRDFGWDVAIRRSEKDPGHLV